jgi:hypothetical protein
LILLNLRLARIIHEIRYRGAVAWIHPPAPGKLEAGLSFWKPVRKLEARGWMPDEESSQQYAVSRKPTYKPFEDPIPIMLTADC